MPAVRLPDCLQQTCQRILVVDDDPDILYLVQLKLERAGFEVDAVPSALQALDTIQRRGLPHLAIVDIMMPVMDGLQFCSAVHEFSDLPVIIMSAVSDPATVVSSLELHAEDYITKPFRLDELVARVRRVLLRCSDFSYAGGPIASVDAHLAIDFPHRRACLDGREIALTPTETRLLYILIGHCGQPVATSFLLRRLWPLDEVYEEALRAQVHRLRAKIEPNPREPKYIVTERGIGYLFREQDAHGAP